MDACALPLNRMTSNRVKFSDNGTWKWLRSGDTRAPSASSVAEPQSATGAILKSTYKAWNDGAPEPIGNSLHHSWGQDGKHVQNTDTAGTSFGKPWHWAGAQNNHAAPLKNPNADTASQNAYNLASAGGAGDPQRRTYVNPTTAGDQRQFWGQGQPEAKDSVNDWRYGKKSKAAAGVFPEVESRFAYFGTVAPTDLDRATDTREKGRVSFFGSGYSYAGSSPRVTSEKIGRDVNPLGRGGGEGLLGGMLNIGKLHPELPLTNAHGGHGSSINNDCLGCPALIQSSTKVQGTHAKSLLKKRPPDLQPPGVGPWPPGELFPDPGNPWLPPQTDPDHDPCKRLNPPGGSSPPVAPQPWTIGNPKPPAGEPEQKCKGCNFVCSEYTQVRERKECCVENWLGMELCCCEVWIITSKVTILNMIYTKQCDSVPASFTCKQGDTTRNSPDGSWSIYSSIRLGGVGCCEGNKHIDPFIAKARGQVIVDSSDCNRCDRWGAIRQCVDGYVEQADQDTRKLTDLFNTSGYVCLCAP